MELDALEFQKLLTLNEDSEVNRSEWRKGFVVNGSQKLLKSDIGNICFIFRSSKKVLK